MKKVSLVALWLIVSVSAFCQTADDVVSKFVEASGGKDKLNAINTIQYNQVIKLKTPMGNFDIPLQFYKDKNKLFRLEASMSFGGQSLNFVTVISDTAGYLMVPNNPMMGLEGGLKKMDEKERAAQTYQLDVAGYFANLVDYASKGHKVELLKDEKVKKEDCYKLKLTMNTGQELVYLINKTSSLIARMDTEGEVAASMSGMGTMMNGMGAGGNVRKLEVSTSYTEYKDVDGIKFPSKIVIAAPMGDSESEISDIRINKTIDPKLYKAS